MTTQQPKNDHVAGGSNRPEPRLMPCPFCGCEHIKIEWFGFSTLCILECGNRDCGAEGPCKATEAEAVAAWNSQQENNKLRAANAVLTEALQLAFTAFGRAGGNTAGGPYRAEWEACREALRKAGA